MKPQPPRPIEETEITYAFDLIIGTAEGPESIVNQVTELLWDKYGSRYLKGHSPPGSCPSRNTEGGIPTNMN